MYDVAVVGSGYGGAVMAARLSAHGQVLLVERGRRWSPGDFPSSALGLVGAYRRRDNPLGLWEMRFGPGTGNAMVSAYGGASLVNYGITSRPEDRVFDDWPLKAAELSPYFQRAATMLGANAYPLADTLGDKAFLDRMEPGLRVDLQNTIDWKSCTLCGDCPLGCNEGAKRSLDQTYLKLAEEQGAKLALGRQLVDLRQGKRDGWTLTLRRTDGDELETLSARRVVLATGTFGTLDLLHSLSRSLPTSECFGQRMTMNGDGLAFIYNTNHTIDGHHGAPITTSVRVPFVDPAGRTRTLMIMSGRLPRSIMRVAGALAAVAADALPGAYAGRPAGSLFQRAGRRIRDLLGVGEGGALSQTFMYKLDAEDSSRGRVRFDDSGCSALDWPDFGEDPIMRFASQRLKLWADRIGGRVIRDLGSWPGMTHMGVHPLGGCRMGRSVADGVVDSFGRVFRPDGSVYPGLRIMDASILPSALGVPSSFTLAALAERVAEDMVGEVRRPAPASMA